MNMKIETVTTCHSFVRGNKLTPGIYVNKDDDLVLLVVAKGKAVGFNIFGGVQVAEPGGWLADEYRPLRDDEVVKLEFQQEDWNN